MYKIYVNFVKNYIFEIFYFFYFCYLFFDLSHGANSSVFFYISFFIFIFIISIIRNLISFELSLVDLIPTAIILSAIIGVTVAFYQNIEPIFILRNSIGLFMFGFYFVFSIYFKPDQLTKIISNVSIMANIFILISLLYRNEFYLLGLGSQRFIYSPLIVFAFVIYPYLLNQLFDHLFFNKFYLTRIAFIIINIGIVIFNVYLVSLSKGALLGIIVISLFYLLLKIYHLGKISINRVMMFVSLSYITIIFWTQTGIINKIFGNNDIGNQSRFLQNEYLLRETSFWGNGLGSYLLNGFYRDGNLKYSYESTFFNYLNKLGIFWFLILFSFIFAAFLLFIKKKLDSKSLLCLGTFFYILISLGNPSLFGPSYVTLACLGLILIREDFYIRKHTP